MVYQKIFKKYYQYMKLQKMFFLKCVFKFLITGNLRLTTTFSRWHCIFLAPPPHVCVNTVPSEVQLMQTTERWKGVWGGGGVWFRQQRSSAAGGEGVCVLETGSSCVGCQRIQGRNRNRLCWNVVKLKTLWLKWITDKIDPNHAFIH